MSPGRGVTCNLSVRLKFSYNLSLSPAYFVVTTIRKKTVLVTIISTTPNRKFKYVDGRCSR